MAARNLDTSVLGSTTQVTGNLFGNGGLRVEGTVRGSIAIKGPLEIGPDASVVGDVAGQSLTLEGELDGNVETTGPISIGPKATYRGVLRGARVSISPGARVSAQLDTEDFDLRTK